MRVMAMGLRSCSSSSSAQAVRLMQRKTKAGSRFCMHQWYINEENTCGKTYVSPRAPIYKNTKSPRPRRGALVFASFQKPEQASLPAGTYDNYLYSTTILPRAAPSSQAPSASSGGPGNEVRRLLEREIHRLLRCIGVPKQIEEYSLPTA